MCLTRDEKSREKMTAVGGRSCGEEAARAAAVTDSGMEHHSKEARGPLAN